MLKSCKWDGAPFEAEYPNEQYCSDYCKEQARLDKKRKWQNSYDKKPENKIKKKNLKKGTFDLPKFKLTSENIPSYLGVPLPFWEWYKEYKVIQNLKKLHKNSRPLNKEKEFDDLTFNIIFPLENSAPCPICKGEQQDKDFKHAETVCRNPDCEGHGGLIIQGPPGYYYPPGKAKMAVTAQDITTASTLQQKGKDVSPQDIAWTRFFE